MNEKVAAFDIEIATLIPDGERDWKKHRPLGITCAAIATPRGTWTYAATDADGAYSGRMTVEQCRELLDDLQTLRGGGYDIISWNGLGFDWDILGEEADAQGLCAKIATSEDHIDMMFHFFCDKGYPVGLDAVSKGLGLPGKPEDVSGAIAPQLWLTDPERVLDYVRSDAQQTLDVYRKSHYQKVGGIRLRWTARSGRRNTWTADRWLSAKEALVLPDPNTSWMTNPMTRGQFYGWAAELLGVWETDLMQRLTENKGTPPDDLKETTGQFTGRL